MKDERYIYKQKASDYMADKYNQVIPVLLVTGLVGFVINLITTNYRPKYEFNMAFQLIETDPGNPGVVFLLSIVSFIVTTLFLYGTTKMYIETARNLTPKTDEILTIGFKESQGRSLILSFLISLFSALWALLFIIPGIVKAYAYSMSFYLLHREPGIEALGAIGLSKQLTRGNKWSLFILDLSYFGWYILGLFTFGILWLWIAPKHMTARTLYFEEIYDTYKPSAAFQKVEDNVFTRNIEE